MSTSVEVPLPRRIRSAKEKVKITALFDHFGYPYRTLGNTRCPWHGPDLHPSARIYEDQNTFWCWTCNPNYGVDPLEFVVIELNLEVEVDPQFKIQPAKGKSAAEIRRALAVIKALEYLEEHFDCRPDSESYEARISNALREPTPSADQACRYWEKMHLHILERLANSTKTDRFQVYVSGIANLEPLMNEPMNVQSPVWDALSSSL